VCSESLCKSQRLSRPLYVCQLFDVMEDKKPAISRCFAATQLCTPFAVDQHLIWSWMLAAIFPRMDFEVLADDHRIPGQSVSL
jgi:hypothetical protein